MLHAYHSKFKEIAKLLNVVSIMENFKGKLFCVTFSNNGFHKSNYFLSSILFY